MFVIKDDLSRYAWIRSCSGATAAHAAQKFARLQRTFTEPRYWVSDQGAHFVHDILQSMEPSFGIQHPPTVAYPAWVNRTVENLNRNILVALRTMVGELKLAPCDWTAVIGALPLVLNKELEQRLGKNFDGTARSPLHVMTGICPQRVLLQVMTERAQVTSKCSLHVPPPNS